jgi:hypothetical protein
MAPAHVRLRAGPLVRLSSVMGTPKETCLLIISAPSPVKGKPAWVCHDVAAPRPGSSASPHRKDFVVCIENSKSA